MKTRSSTSGIFTRRALFAFGLCSIGVLVRVTFASGANGFHGGEPPEQAMMRRFAATPPELISVVSRKVHGTTGPWDIDLPTTGAPGVECRFGGGNRDYQLVFTFGTDVASVGSVMTSAGSVSNSSFGPNSNQYTVDLTGVPNAQYVTVTINGVQDVDGGAGNASGTMGMLLGDTNGNGVVNSTDLVQTKSRVGHFIDANTFRSDIQPNGSISAADITLVKLNIGLALP